MSKPPHFFVTSSSPPLRFMEAQKLLYDGMDENNLEKVRLAIESGATPNVNVFKSELPLVYALNKGDVQILDYLWECGGRFPIQYSKSYSKSYAYNSFRTKEVFVWIYEKEYFSYVEKDPMKFLNELKGSYMEAPPAIFKWLIQENKLGNFADYLAKKISENKIKLDFYFSDIFNLAAEDETGECLSVFIEKLDQDMPFWRKEESTTKLIRDTWVNGIKENNAGLLNALQEMDLIPIPYSEIEKYGKIPLIKEVLLKSREIFSPSHTDCLDWFLSQDEWRDEFFKNEDWPDVVINDNDIIYHMADFLLDKGFDIFTPNSKGENLFHRLGDVSVSTSIKNWVLSKNRPDALLAISKTKKEIKIHHERGFGMESRRELEEYMLSQLPQAVSTRIKPKI